MAEKEKIINADRSIIIAADFVDVDTLQRLSIAVKGVREIGAIKIGFLLGYTFNLHLAVNILKENLCADTKIIFDHQKAGNDIPDMGIKFAQLMKKSGVDAAILFPFTGPKTQREWTRTLQEEGVGVLIGGAMTHANFLQSEGGYIADTAVREIYQLGADMGVRDFVVPGTRPDLVKKIREEYIPEFKDQSVFYSPGFITQGGEISEYVKVAGSCWHAIVGSAIYDKKTAVEMRTEIEKLIKYI